MEHPVYEDNNRTMTVNTFHGGGWGDQFIIVLPDDEIVLAFNCGNYVQGLSGVEIYDMMSHYILPACIK